MMVSFSTTKTSLTKTERKFAITELKDSKKHLQKAVKGLSAAQLNFKASRESWSIAECTEHLALSETLIYDMLEGALKQPADPSRRAEVKVTDDKLLSMIIDRSNKVKTQEPFKPTGKFGSQENTLKEFVDKRDSHIDFIRKTNEDLRNRYQQLPFGIIDAYQILLLLSGHTERHIAQIEEVKADPNFPKSWLEC